MYYNGRLNYVCFAVHGGFSEWMEWGACSVFCGTGVQRRLRQCNNPFPANGGRHCIGTARETRSCQGKPCPGKLVHLFIPFAAKALHCEHFTICEWKLYHMQNWKIIYLGTPVQVTGLYHISSMKFMCTS